MTRKILLILTGVISIGLSIGAFSKEDGDWVSHSYYGGDAYTGIQNAAADTGKNVHYLIESVNYGFGSILLIGGLSCIAFAFAPCKKEVEN